MKSTRILLFFFTNNLKIIIFSQKLEKTIFTPIYNKDDPKVPENYRPTSITGVLSKVFDKLLNKLITDYLFLKIF